MPATNTPDAEVDIDDELIRHLLAEQSPDRAGLPIEFVAAGWDNALFRLGDDEVVRLPRRQIGADLVAHEQRWLHQLAPRLPLPIPTPTFHGSPSSRFPWPWSICPWLEGEPGTVASLADPVAAAVSLGVFLAALHTDAPTDAPRNPYRGIPLADRDERTQVTLRDLDDIIDTPVVTAAWNRSVAIPAWTGAPVWVHGDLHPGNLLVHDGRLAAVIDFGDLCAGDPATDLGVAWMLFGPAERAAFRTAVGVDEDTWDRGRGWAIGLGLAVLSSSADHPDYTAFGHHALDQAVAELG